MAGQPIATPDLLANEGSGETERAVLELVLQKPISSQLKRLNIESHHRGYSKEPELHQRSPVHQESQLFDVFGVGE